MKQYFGFILLVLVASFIALDAQRPEAESPNPICTLPFETGLCYASIQRWFYNNQSRRCQTFTYGGCGGNKNNFQSQLDCQRTCRGFRG